MQQENKKCTKCLGIKVITDFAIKTKTRRAAVCKKCFIEINKIYRHRYKKKFNFNNECLVDFKLNGGKVSKPESEFLKSKNLKWCPKCKIAKELNSFYFSDKRNRYRCECKDCERERNRLKKYKYSINNSVKSRLRGIVKRIVRGKINTFSLVGVESVHDFISKMNAKTDNKNWINENYHIDHIWQLHWFSDFLVFNFSNKLSLLEVAKIINHHSNLRPLTRQENRLRKLDDFTPLKKDDFYLFQPYLNKNISKRIMDYFNI
jgi:hypothetical protein